MSEEKNELQSYSPHGLISQALAQNVPIETLERLMDLQERWQTAQAKTAYLKAMSKFQSICPVVKKTKKVNYPSKTGGNVKYEYTPLNIVTKTIQQALSDCGLSYRWEFEDKDSLIICYCIVSHIDGHSEKTFMSAGADTTGNKNNIQSIGSTRTYLQRYTLIGALGLSTADEDNDGKTSEKPKEPIPEPKTKSDPIIEKISNCKTVKELNDLWPSVPSDKQKDYVNNFATRKAEITKKK
jgi:hypothetical protein